MHSVHKQVDLGCKILVYGETRPVMITRTEHTRAVALAHPASLYLIEPFSTYEWEERNLILGPVLV